MSTIKIFKRDFSKWSVYTILVLIFLLVPIFTIFLKLFSLPGESWNHILENLLLRYSLNTIFLILGCTILTFLLGVSSAWIISRYQVKFSRYFEWMLILPLAIPSYITAYAYAGFFDYGGTLELLSQGFLPKINITNIYGLIFVLSVSLFPYVYVSSRVVFIYQSARLIEVSKLMGFTEIKTFFKIVLPIARPAIVGGLILVIMEVLNDYGAAKYYGVNTFTTGIFRVWFSLDDSITAVYLSAILLAIVFLLISLERFQRGDRNYELLLKSNIKLPKIRVSKRKQVSLWLILFFPVLVGFLIPFFQLLYWAYLSFDSVFSTTFFNITIQSLVISFIAAFLIVFCSLLILYLPKWNRLKLLKKTSNLATIGYAVPGAVIAIGIMIPTIQLDKSISVFLKSFMNIDVGFLLNGTVFVLVYAYIIRFLAVAYNPIEASSLKIGKSLPESSKILGKTNIQTFFKIQFPLLKTSLISAFILVFVDIMKELPLTLILKPYEVNTLAVKAYEYASDEMIIESALPSLFIIFTGLVPIFLLNKLILNEK